MYGFGLIAALSYLLGSLSMDPLAARLKNPLKRSAAGRRWLDRSGNAGRKILPLLSEGPTVALNVSKGLAAVLAARYYPASAMGMLIAGLFVVLGHTWPFLGFLPRQKGVAVAVGAMLPVAPLPAAVMMGVWVTVFALTRYASVSWVASFGALPLILYFVRRRDVFVIYGVLMSAMAVIQMAGGLARVSEGRIVHSDDEGPFVDEGDENGENEDEPIRKKKTGLRIAAGVLGVLTALVWLGNQYVYHGFGVGVDVIRSGNPDLPVVALTFDDGPDPEYTPRILDILKREGVPATFFLVGKHVERYPGIARRIVEEGHCVGNHSYSHLNMPLLGEERTLEEVEGCEKAILRVCGVRPHLFRPPRGLADAEMSRALRDRGYTVALWRLSSRDWAEPSWREIVSTCNRASNGDIILFHDSGSLVTSEGGSRENTVTALPAVIRNLRNRGFRFVTVDELIALSNPAEQ